ncbi:extracellular solute-binding protein [Streptomyces sp. NPDC051243]|uniref:extracellular solute-binding protein n=1 Tax=Streptomyces sp. NPDC051243 TaxID=3365646 RepID=UPI00379AD580
MRRPTTPLARCLLVVGLLLTAVGCGASGTERVTIMVPWTKTEFAAFYSVIQAFEDNHPTIEVDPRVTRDLTPQLDAAVAADAAPDLAVLPNVGALTKFHNDDVLETIEVDTESFLRPFGDLAVQDGDVYAVPVKADVKSLIWYDPKVTVPPPPRTWSALRSRPEPWCLGLASGPTSGWPGADWIADIVLAEEGIGTYEAWVSGKRKWESKPVADAWSMWHDLIERNGSGLAQASTVAFDAAAAGMKDNSCSLSRGALSATGLEPQEVRKYTTVEPPENQPLEVSADFVVKFTGSESATELIEYLASTEAQQAWVDEPGFALSAHKDVTRYRDSTQGKVARMLRSGHPLCFSAADAMDPDVSAAFYQAVLEYVNGEDLTELLRSLDRVQETLGRDDSPASTPLCGTPNQP